MSPFGAKRTFGSLKRMTALEGKADIPCCSFWGVARLAGFSSVFQSTVCLGGYPG